LRRVARSCGDPIKVSHFLFSGLPVVAPCYVQSRGRRCLTSQGRRGPSAAPLRGGYNGPFLSRTAHMQKLSGGTREDQRKPEPPAASDSPAQRVDAASAIRAGARSLSHRLASSGRSRSRAAPRPAASCGEVLNPKRVGGVGQQRHDLVGPAPDVGLTHAQLDLLHGLIKQVFPIPYLSLLPTLSNVLGTMIRGRSETRMIVLGPLGNVWIML